MSLKLSLAGLLARREIADGINLPTFDLVDTVVGIGNCHGADVDKFQRFGLTAKRATKVAPPLIAECYANFDSRMIRAYGLFIWEVVKAHVATSPKRPQTIHYRGEGEFMISEPQSTAAASSGRRTSNQRNLEASLEIVK